MYFQTQAEYVHYHSPEQRAMRSARAESERLAVVRNAQVLFNDGDIAGARQVLFDGGISDDGVGEYLRLWRDN